MKINKLLVGILTFTSLNCFAIQEFQVTNNAELDAIISNHDVNRIAIAGARITQVKYTSKILKIDTDEENGQIFVYPISSGHSSSSTVSIGNLKAKTIVGEMISLFVIDNQGRSFNLKLRLQGVSSETILIKPLLDSKVNASTDFTTQVVTIIETMYLNNRVEDDYVVKEYNSSIKLWKEVDFEMYKTYSNEQFLGTVYYLRNKTSKPINLVENQFWKPNTVAIAIEKPTLEPNEVTRIFVVGAKQDE